MAELNEKELSTAELDQVVGGNGEIKIDDIQIGKTYTISAPVYAPLLDTPFSESTAEKGCLWNGSTVTVLIVGLFNDYAYVTVDFAAPGEAGYEKATAGMQGFVYKKYLI